MPMAKFSGLADHGRVTSAGDCDRYATASTLSSRHVPVSKPSRAATGGASASVGYSLWFGRAGQVLVIDLDEAMMRRMAAIPGR
jgi:hypothetical protein